MADLDVVAADAMSQDDMTNHHGLGPTAYRQYCDALGVAPDAGLSPSERAAALPSWLSRELISTEAARDKLHAWAAVTARTAWDARPDPAETLVALSCVGDTVLPHVIARLLCDRIPPPVAAYCVERVTWIAVGAVVLGFCAPPVAFGDRPWLIVVSARGQDEPALETFDSLTAHEVAHAWLCPEPTAGTRVAGAFSQHTIYDLPIERVPAANVAEVERRRAAYERDEELALALTRSWGVADIGRRPCLT